MLLCTPYLAFSLPSKRSAATYSRASADCTPSSGYLLWTIFLGLDSDQYPLRSYGDLAFRLYGRTARHCFNVLQSVQLLCSVGVIIVSNGQALSQVSKFRLCYAICCLLWAICVSCQVTLKVPQLTQSLYLRVSSLAKSVPSRSMAGSLMRLSG